MRLVCISDTHNYHAKLQIPDGDILIHAGDFSNHGKPKEVASFCNWFAQQPHKYKIAVTGNHDLSLDCSHINANLACQSIVRDYMMEDKFAFFTHNALAIEGVQFFFSSFTPTYGNWAFMLTDDALALKWAQIPAETQVLVTHGPPKGILDSYEMDGVTVQCGSASLLQRVQLLNNLKLHVFGHIHESHGKLMQNGVQFANVAICDRENVFVNNATVIDL